MAPEQQHAVSLNGKTAVNDVLLCYALPSRNASVCSRRIKDQASLQALSGLDRL
jgi:hypothetical protein